MSYNGDFWADMARLLRPLDLAAVERQIAILERLKAPEAVIAEAKGLLVSEPTESDRSESRYWFGRRADIFSRVGRESSPEWPPAWLGWSDQQ